jgi:KaiC/GvpD/RAD55 family RecA-like ATPase
MAFYDISRGGLHLPGTAKTSLTGGVAAGSRRAGKVTELVNLQSAAQRLSSQEREFSFFFRQLRFYRAIPLDARLSGRSHER